MTPEQIQRRQTAWTVLRYEREMYEATWNLIRLPLHSMFHYTVVNAIVESHSLHIRNLCNFLVGLNGGDDLEYTDLVERFEEIDIEPLTKVWHLQIDGHPGSPSWVLSVMSDCTIYRRSSYDYNSIAVAIHGPLVELMDQIEKVRIWEVLNCQHEMIEDVQCCEKCGASKHQIYHLRHSQSSPPPTPEASDEEKAGEEAGGEEVEDRSREDPAEDAERSPAGE